METITKTEIETIIAVLFMIFYVLQAIYRGIKKLLENKAKIKEIENTSNARKELLNKVISIEHSQKYQSDQITLLLDLNKNFKDRQLLEQQIIDIVSETDENVCSEVRLTIENGGDEAIKIFNYILLNDFKVEVSSIQNKIEVALKKISKVCNCDKLQIKNIEDFKSELKESINKLILSYTKSLPATFKKHNGIRRADFIDKSTTLVLQIISEVEILHKKHK